jgi:hypothetical protein
MANIVKPPQPVKLEGQVSVFLAGTIDNGQSVDWQSDVERSLADLDVLIMNPRRDEWDASWEQSIKNAKFKEQVEWELNALDAAEIIFLYFAPNSQSPISLLELGLYASSNKLIIVCPAGFWRVGNVEVVADRYGIPLYRCLASGIKALKDKII